MLVFKLHPRYTNGGFMDLLTGVTLLSHEDTARVPEDADLDMSNLRKALALKTIVIIRGELEPAVLPANPSQVIPQTIPAQKLDMTALPIAVQAPVPEEKMVPVGSMTLQQTKADGTFAKKTSPKSSGTNKGSKKA